MMKNATWQPIEGMKNAFWYPFICKPTFMTSNTFIIEIYESIMIIDPGNSVEQLAGIRQVIANALTKKPRPVIVYLTHCHVDHCFEFLRNPSVLTEKAPVFAAVQENGIDAVSHKDRELTGSGRYKTAVPDANIDICLLSAEDRKFSVVKKLSLTDDLQLTLTTKTLLTPAGNQLFMQEISLNQPFMKAYYTPGHSPDGVSFQIGDILCIGDCMFAADYLIAGLPGWSREDTLTSSENLLWLIENENISMVAQGHGESMASDKASEKLKRMIQSLPQMTIHKKLDTRTIITSSQHAMDVSREANDIIITMMESLRHVVHYLDFLEEPQEATQYASTLDSKKMGQMFSIFNEMTDELNSGKLIEGFLVHRFASLFIAIKEMLRAEGLEHVAGPALIARLQRLLDDFIRDSGGREVKKNLAVFEAEEFFRSLIKNLKKDKRAGEDIFDALDDDHAFVTLLTERIAYRPLYQYLSISVAAERDIWIHSDRERLAEIMEIIMEMMVEQGSKELSLNISRDETTVHIAIDGGLVPTPLATESYQKRALTRRLNWIDSAFHLMPGKCSAVIVLTIPAKCPSSFSS